jgi:hypothetical protein
VSSNDRDQLGAETLRGCLILSRTAWPGGADGMKQKLIETLGCRRCGASRSEEARERRSDEIPVKASVNNLGRVKPKGATSGRRTKHTSGRQGLVGWVKAQKSQLVKPAPALRCKGIQTSQRYVGSSRPETVWLPAARRKLRRANPRSAAGAKQNRHGFEGSKPSRG